MNQTLTEDLAPASASQETGLLEAVKASKSLENADESRLPLQTVDRVNSPTRKQKRYPIKWLLHQTILSGIANRNRKRDEEALPAFARHKKRHTWLAR